MPFSGNTYSRFKTFANSGSLLPSDLNSVQDDIGNKVADILKINPSARVATLPTTNLVEDMEVNWVPSMGGPGASASDYGVTWRMKYRAGAPGGLKWECVGGMPIASWVDSSATMTVGRGFNTIGTGDVQDYVIPVAGSWKMVMNLGSVENKSTSDQGTVFAAQPVAGIGIEGQSPLFAAQVHLGKFSNTPVIPNTMNLHKERQPTLAAGVSVGLRYQAFNQDCIIYGRYFSIIPCRVAG